MIRKCLLVLVVMAGCATAPTPTPVAVSAPAPAPAAAPAPVPVAANTPPSIVGLWAMKGIGKDSSPEVMPGCAGTIDFRPDGTTLMGSGEQSLTGRYFVQTQGGQLVLSQRDLKGNNGKNCQGLTTDFVIEHTVADARMVLKGDSMKLYPPVPGDVFFELTRVR
ncbi:hypothetical protein DSM104443_01092 [Usitatibacter rugosus]|uniref:META domain-containing protein n=1 Tax=Usitatibacter rugosus TaxID=2732067 RepID=A0A6M4GS10_9PROT|nr:hypothetical protein [Usitatibacter rugosus]QJR10041.1 hypothetical protein DSM104443_01092 [Usitatibacter rugosus]